MTHTDDEGRQDSALLDWPPPVLRAVSPPTYWRCEADWAWDARPLPEYLLWCVLDGVGTLRLHGRTGALTAGSCAVFAPGDAPRARHDPRRRLLVFGIHFDAYDAAGRRLAPARIVPPHNGSVTHDRGLLVALAGRAEAAHRQPGRYAARSVLLCLEQLLCLLWTDAGRPAPDPVDATLDEIARDLRQDPGRRWTVPELAARTRLSRAQFTRRFTARTGLSPARYLIRARIDRAHELLTRTTMSAARIAHALGYSDPAYFARQYRQLTGEPPSSSRTGP
ncbi:hypothetical protein Athai_10840 [Actinocatenispora thailandica]|uniref:HTH araC/xylS-type domain-containing protein n=1 Tax=Actinocatenispora thailandica TaxID=227318 RepID=A0A7R7DL51_9ACTN|nr:AraC family transcriptional regulator [Actinocatenispora thailandica]BCJ33581.1 hypothetical protein Athai_10840 [Actinocatenispora thailandica]